ncbi:hypothetical protein Ddc_00743 [Ditylenchus destructor]|nr:hypothetical protein Ddc_00743 [Ditylenchus destructor]
MVQPQAAMANLAELEDTLAKLNLSVTKLGTRPQLSMPSYTGRGDQSSFQHHVKKFNVVATAYGWSEEDCCQIFPTTLKGESFSIYESLTEAIKMDWKNLLKEMAKKLAIGDGCSAFRRQVQSRKQRENESLSEFASAVRELCDKGFPDSQGYTAQMKEDMSIDIFRNGVIPSIRTHVNRATRTRF